MPPGPPATVKVIVAPPATVVAPAVTVGVAVTVTVALVATFAPANSRALQVDPPNAGAVNVIAAPVWPVAGGVCVLLRYFQSRYGVSAPVAGQYTPTQSKTFPGPLATVKVMVAPA